MRRLKVRRMCPKGPLDIIISSYPKNIDAFANPEVGDELLDKLRTIPQFKVFMQSRRLEWDNTYRTIDTLVELGLISEKLAWKQLLLRQRFTHFCTLTIARPVTKAFLYKILDLFIKKINRKLLGKNWSRPEKREFQPLIMAFLDKGSDQKTSKRLRRESKGTSSRTHRIKYSDENLFHFHLLIKFSDKPTIKTHNTIAGVPDIWKRMNKTFRTKSCNTAKIGPIEDMDEAIGYCLKNFHDLPLDRVTPSD